MEQKQKLSINTREIGVIFFFFFILSIFFSIRYILPSQTAFETGAYSDFTSISLYLSDILLIISAFFAFLPRGEEKIPRGNTIIPRDIRLISLYLLGCWLATSLLFKIGSLNSLNWYFFVKFIELLVAYGTSVRILTQENTKRVFLWIFVLLSSIEAILSLSQFISQSSIGLYKFGEQLISPDILGVAKIVVNGVTYVRGYGTFPHPNLLAAFLVVSNLTVITFIKNANSLLKKFVFSIILLINLVGLTTTFSRAGYLAFITGLVLWTSFNLYKKIEIRKVIWTVTVTMLSLISVFVAFKPFLLTRATFTDQSSIDRVFYSKIGIRLIKDHPLLGVGIGESVLHMQQYSPKKLSPWEIQPIHNYFLLTAADTGIIGALLLLFVVIVHLVKLFQLKFTTHTLLLSTVIIASLVLMQFDHYFYTLQQTQMLLWIILGFANAQTKTSS